jgi:membrane-associated phospholipid phosphatase
MIKRKELLLSFLVLFLFGVFTLIVKSHITDGIDLDITVKSQNHLPVVFDTAFSVFSLLGSAEIISFLILPIFLIYKWRSVVIFFSYGFGMLIEVIGKTFLDHKGPPHLFFRYDLNFEFPTSYIQTYHSYPSGHSFRTIFIISIWLLILFQTAQSKQTKTLITLVSLFFCVIMLFSRITLGEHWTTDVIGGSLLGLGMALGSFALTQTPLVMRKSKK